MFEEVPQVLLPIKYMKYPSFTNDMWRQNTRQSFLGLRVHRIIKALTKTVKLLQQAHMGTTISETFLYSFD